MENSAAETRRENLRRLIERDFGSNQSEFAREYFGADHPQPHYISGLLKGSKSFGEKTARKAELAAGLLPRELDTPNSPLRLDPSRASAVRHELQAEFDDLEKDLELQREVLSAVRQIKARYRVTRRKAG